MTDTFDGVEAFSLDYLDLRHAHDGPIRAAALDAEAIVLTKDHGFAEAMRRSRRCFGFGSATPARRR